jgi:hypothetical protein
MMLTISVIILYLRLLLASIFVIILKKLKQGYGTVDIYYLFVK